MSSVTTTLTTQPPVLTDLADQINAAHHAAETALNAGLKHALEAGRLLLKAKSQVGHGEWLPWVKEHFEGTPRTATTYIRLVKRWPEITNRQRASDLTIRGAVKLLTQPKAAKGKAYHDLAYWENRLRKLSPKVAQWRKDLRQPDCPLELRELVKMIREINEVLNNHRLQWLLEDRRFGLAYRDLEAEIGGMMSSGYRKLWRQCSLLVRLEESDILDWAADVMDHDGEVTFDGLRKAVMCGDVAVLETGSV